MKELSELSALELLDIVMSGVLTDEQVAAGR